MPTKKQVADEISGGIDAKMEKLLGEVMTSITPKILRELRSHTGLGMEDLGDMPLEDQLQFIAYAANKAVRPDLTWDEAADIAPLA